MTPPSRLVAGLMSGTSLDGVDAVVVHLTGSGRGLHHDLRAFVTCPYPPDLRSLILENAVDATSSVRAVSQLNVRLAHAFADAVRAAAGAAGLPVAALDLVGSHGQTLHHVPLPEACAGRPTTSTLQVGDPSVLAHLLGVPVVGDFRLADMALGGQGAPLVPYFDYVYFADDAETRLLLNVGGIANLTVLPAGGGPDAVRAFDTGPGNMVLDALARRFFDRPYDPGGTLAAGGSVDEALLADLLADPFFALPPPRSTGREHFGPSFVERLAASALPPADLLATATELTARSIHDACRRFVAPWPDVLIVSGGGVHNATLMRRLEALFAPVPVRTAAAYGLDGDAKEALCFAVLAHETMNGVPTSLPSVTGARRPALLGKICLPG